MNIIRQTESLCPVCLKQIQAQLVDQDNKIYILKECIQHGAFKDIYYGDSKLYYKYMQHFKEGKPKEIFSDNSSCNCNDNCGICDNHRSSTILANIDITNFCNYNCPVCFANAENSNKNGDPGIDVIAVIMDNLRNLNPPCEVVQLTGGEPTLREDFFSISKMAKDKGFAHIQVATNGLKLAKDSDFAAKMKEAHVTTVYLQFDGVTSEPYQETRGFNAWPHKLQALENLEKNGRTPNVVLVPTLIKGVNDRQVGDIIRFAAKYNCVQGVNFQPVSFSGRIDTEELMNQRITIADFIALTEEQTNGQIKADDFFTLPIFHSLLEYLKRIDSNGRYPNLNTHPSCGAWTYVFKDGDKLIPLNRLINVEEVFNLVAKLKSKSKREIAAKVTLQLPKLIKMSSFKHSGRILSILKNLLLNDSYQASRDFHNKNVLFVGAMHFMDAYNYDIERIERCCIHYAVPDGRIIPFCSYNTIHRQRNES